MPRAPLCAAAMEPARAAEGDPGPGGDPGPEGDPEADCDPDPAADPVSEGDPDVTRDPDPEADPVPEGDPETTCDPEAAADPELQADPDPDVDPDTNPGPEGDPDVDPDIEGDPDVDPDLEGDPDVDPELQGDPDVDPELEGDPDLDPDPEGDPDVDPELEGDPDADPDLEGDPDVDPDIEGDPDVDPDLEGDPDVDPELEGDPEADPDLEGDPDVDPDLEGDPDVDPELEGDPDVDPDTNPGPEGDPDVDPELEGDPDVDPDPEGDPDVDPDLEGDPDVDPELEGDPDLDPELQGDPDVDSDLEGDPDVDPELEGDPDADPDLEGDPDTTSDPDADPQADPDAPLLWPAGPEPAPPDPAADPDPADPDPADPAAGPRLRAVFDALDADGDGLVRTDDFVQFATVYGAEQVKDLTRHLDPSGLGVISFEDFFRGITAIRSGDPEGPLAPEEEPQVCPDEFDDFVTYEATEVTDSAYMGSESTYSECETFTDEDTSTLVHPELHPEGDADSTGGSAVASECLDGMEDPSHGALLLLPGRSLLHSQAVVTVIGGEEHFEDYGEGGDGELSMEALCNGDQACSGPAFLTPSADPLATKLHGILADEAFEFYCSQCYKQINRLEDLSARLNDLEMNSPTKRLSSKKVARHLLQSGALSMEALQAPPSDPSEDTDEDIADKVVFLEKRVSELERDTVANGEQHSRLRQENLQLVHRANALEEQLKEQELRACETVLEEARRQRELLCRMEREKSIEVENLQARLQQLDEENSELRSCTPCLKASIQRLGEEKQKLLDEIEELSLRLSEEQENRRRLGDRLSQERHQFQRDKEATQELIEDLRKQLEHLQLFKLEAEQRRGRSSSTGLQQYNSRTRESELEQEVRRLKQDNRSLKEQNDELNGQIITLSIQGAKNLFSTSFSESLAAEISSVSRDELMEAIQKQEEINLRLQDYIDRIIVAIMETNPSILEVK